ncbi:MAG: LuxR family transcriptional regulator [Verrucomicrobiaceae bacterium]|nr:MAG: LuxR family transcriptional regulator [Verrucomicrobiaceae bacterium]
MPSSNTPRTGTVRRKTPRAYPQTATDPALAPHLSALQEALNLTDLWRAAVALLDAALPNLHYVAALPCVEDRPIFVISTVPGQDQPGYWDQFLSCEPPLARVIMAQPLAKTAYLNDHWGDDELSATPFHQKIMEPEGWWYAAGFLFWGDNGFVGHLGMNRTREQGPYQPHEREILEELHVHVAAAVRRVAAFDSERAKRAALEEVLKQQPDGMVILDWELRQVFRNRAADDFCRRCNELQDEAGAALPSEVADAAGKLLTESESLLRQPPSGKVGAPVTEIFHREIEGLQARIRLLHPREKQAIKPHCLIEFSRVLDRPGYKPTASFTLSMAERRVAELVAQGKSNSVVAAELHLSIHTVRAHLREIFSKLNIRHRSELVAVLSRGSR